MPSRRRPLETARDLAVICGVIVVVWVSLRALTLLVALVEIMSLSR